jgi:hypothetical protein
VRVDKLKNVFPEYLVPVIIQVPSNPEGEKALRDFEGRFHGWVEASAEIDTPLGRTEEAESDGDEAEC